MVLDAQEQVRILVVDDEPTIIDFLETGLAYEGYAVAAVADGNAALEAVRTFSPDVVVLDLMLPGLDGLQVCGRLRATSDVGILMLTARTTVDDRVIGLESGADDYLVKPFKFKELLARVRAILRRRRIALPHVVQIDDLRLDRATREVTRANIPVRLTPREWELLELLMLHPRQVLTRETILNRVWGYDYIGDTNIVEVHISALRDKLGDHSKERIQTVRGVGYTLRGAV